MKKLFAILLVGCAGADESDICVFDGQYEMGFIAYESRLDCTSNSVTFFGTGEDECSTSIDQVSVNGAQQTGYISCTPGSPVVECEGYVSDSDGCQWQAYVRRIAQ